MKELIVTSNDEGQRLNKYLLKYLNKAPSSFIYKMLRKKNIVLNGKKADGSEIVKVSDSVKLFLSDETINGFREENNARKSNNKNPNSKSENVHSNNISSLKKDIKILYKTKDIIALHKPAGLLSQKAEKTDYSINDYVIEYYNQNNSDSNNLFKPSICNRLDRNTSGIIVAGLTLSGSQFLSEVMRNRDADKYYYTIVSGCFTEDMHVKSYISKDEKNNLSNVISVKEYETLDDTSKKNYNKIETKFIGLSANKNYSLLKIKLITGKSHQIRAHLKQLGYPIVGDSKYGDIQVNRYFRDKYKLKYHLLHSGILTINNYTVVDELPNIFKRICENEHLSYDRL